MSIAGFLEELEALGYVIELADNSIIVSTSRGGELLRLPREVLLMIEQHPTSREDSE